MLAVLVLLLALPALLLLLRALPALRLLLLLVADEKLSYAEVGALTEQSADAVRGKLHRARKLFSYHFEKFA